MLNGIGDCLSELISSNDEGDGEDEDDEQNTEPGMVSEDDKPRWVLGTINKMVQHCMQSFR
jgi:hypothetical protein